MTQFKRGIAVVSKPVSKKLSTILIALVIILQVSILIVEYLGSVWPIWYGKAVVLETQPIDPRSLFRGNYVRLNFDINRLEQDELMPDNLLKVGSVAYLQLKEFDGVWRPVKLSSQAPESGDFIRGRVREAYPSHYRLDYGIEAFFMPKEEALTLQNDVRSYSQFKVYISKSGKARVNSVLCIDENCTIPRN